MVTTIRFEGHFEMPLDIQTLDAFRGWAMSDAFPHRGRVDFVNGRIEVDMSPEDLFTHGTLKVEIIRVLSQIVKETQTGYLFTDSTRVSSPRANLSVEPDIVFVSHDAIQDKRVRTVPKASGETGRYVELEGAPDMVVEIVSDSSVVKDTHDLPMVYFRAGVREYWLVDGRGDALLFVIHQRGPNGFDPVPRDPDGYQCSTVFAYRLQLARTREKDGHCEFDLVAHPLGDGPG